jgi:hypothetical protein
MNVPLFIAAAGIQSGKLELVYIWEQATPEGKAVIFCLVIFSIIAWSVMISKAIQMRRAKKLNTYFNAEFRSQRAVLDVFDRRVQADGCPMFAVYQSGSLELDARLKSPDGARLRHVSLKGMEHVKRTLENSVAQESLKLESGLILLAIAVSGAPFLGLLGTVWCDEHVRSHCPARQRHHGGHGARCRRRPDHDRGRIAGRHPVHVRLQLAGSQPARPDGRAGQLRAGTRVENGNGISRRIVDGG